LGAVENPRRLSSRPVNTLYFCTIVFINNISELINFFFSKKLSDKAIILDDNNARAT